MREKINPAPELKEIEILYVEDEDIIRESLASLISRHIKKLHIAENGEEGLKMYKELSPDVVITDIQMPIKNGLDMAKEIKEINKDARIILTTAFGDSEYLLAAIDLEINGYMIKPINRNRLFSLLNDNAKYVLHEKQKARFQAYAQQIIDSQSNMLILLNSNLEIIKSNKSFMEFFGLDSRERLKDKHGGINEIIVPIDKGDHYINKIDLKTIDKILDGETKKHIVVLKDNHGRYKSFAFHASKLTNEKNMTEYILSFTDVTALDNENRTLEKNVVTDKLTGIYNRHKFDEMLEIEIGKSERSKGSLAIVFFDIDHFKIVNDKHGHDVGDEVLKSFAKIVKSSLRSTDTFARWGGEEFAVLIPDTNIEDATHFAQRLRKDIEEFSFENVGRVTSSFGVALYKSGENVVDFLKRVDNALYEAKNSGRNRVVSSK